MAGKVFSDLFSPLPAGQTLGSEYDTKSGALARTADYMNTTEGAWDFFRIFSQINDCAQKISGLGTSTLAALSRLGRVANLSGIGLSLPLLIPRFNTFFTNVRIFADEKLNPQRGVSPEVQQQRTLQAGRDAVLGGVDFTNTGAQAVLFFHHAELIDLGKYLSGVDTLYQGTCIALDGAGLIKEGYKLASYTGTSAEVSDKRWLSCLEIAKDVFSIATGALALVAIWFTLTVAVAEMVSAAIVVTSTFWLGLKLSTYFYGKVIENRYASPLPPRT